PHAGGAGLRRRRAGAGARGRDPVREAEPVPLPAARAARRVGDWAGAGSRVRPSVPELESGVVRSRDRLRLIAVAHDAQADQIGHVGVGIAALETSAELGARIDLLLAPFADRTARLENDRILHDEEIALLIADASLLRFRAPDVLDRVPLEPALPGYVDHGGRVAEAALALVSALGQHLGAPLPPDSLRSLAEGVRDLGADRHGFERRPVDRADERLRGILDDLVVAHRARIILEHPKGVDVDGRRLEWPCFVG